MRAPASSSGRRRRDAFAPGDHVVMSFPWCGACPNCRRQMEAHCHNASDLKMSGTRADGSTLMSAGGTPVYSAFFQQSSFGDHAIANERFAVKVRKDAPLDLLGPLACSGQTGAGAVLNSCSRSPGDALRRVRRRRGRLVRPDGSENRRLRSDHRVDVHDHRGWRWRANSAPPTRSIIPTAPTSWRKSERSPAVACALRSRPRRSRRSSAKRSMPDAGRHLRAAWQRPQRHRGLARHAVPAVRPQRARRDTRAKAMPQDFIPKLVDFIMQGRCRSNG